MQLRAKMEQNAKLANFVARVERALRPRYLLVGALGVALLLVATVWEYGQFDSMSLLFHKTMIGVLKELGFASLIAVFISVGIEEEARKEFSDTVDQRIEEIQQNVFRSTYGRDLNRSVIDEVEGLILKAPFFRSKHRASYTLTTVSAKSLDSNLADRNVIKVRCSVFYEVRNITKSTQVYELVVRTEKSVFEELRKLARVTYMKVGERTLSEAEIEQADESVKDSASQKSLMYAVDVKAGDVLSVNVVTEFVKSPDDTEIWRSIVPSEDMTLHVRFPKEMKECGADSLHRSELVQDGATGEDDGVREWRIPGPVLPHQGIAFWWRCTQDFKALARESGAEGEERGVDA